MKRFATGFQFVPRSGANLLLPLTIDLDKVSAIRVWDDEARKAGKPAVALFDKKMVEIPIHLLNILHLDGLWISFVFEPAKLREMLFSPQEVPAHPPEISTQLKEVAS